MVEKKITNIRLFPPRIRIEFPINHMPVPTSIPHPERNKDQYNPISTSICFYIHNKHTEGN